MSAGELWRRLWYLLTRARRERELADEMAAHREMMGDPRRFGNALRLREEASDAWGWGWFDRLWQDVRDAARVLRRAPLFALTATLILSAGIGLNLTFYHLLDVTMLRPPAVADPDSLARFTRRAPSSSSSGVPYPSAQWIREHNDVLSAVLTRHRTDVVWEEDPANRLNASYVSANWFTEMGHGAALGRVFSEALDGSPSSSPVVVLSHHFWRARMHADATIVGRDIRLNDRLATIIGVAPPNFPGFDLDNPQVWLLIHQIDHFQPGTPFKDDWTSGDTELYGRLRPGVSPEQVTEGLRPVVAELAKAHPTQFRPDGWLEPAMARHGFNTDRALREIGATAGLIGALTLLVLVVASSNLANFVLSHAIGRLREFSVRVAVGASRWRIVRHILMECGLLAAAGAAGGLVIANATAGLLASIIEIPPYLDFSPDWRLFVVSIVIAMTAMLAFGLIPAWTVSRRDLTRAMRDGGEQASSGLARARLRLVLVAGQVVGCCALLVVAGAIGRGLQRLLVDDPGFSYQQAAVLDASLERHGIGGQSAQVYWSQVAQMVGAHPDVDRVTLAYPAPLGGMINQSSYGADTGAMRVTIMRVEPAFFSTLDIPILAGRSFDAADDESVVIVSRRLALAMYGTLDVIGKGFPRSRRGRTIIGVAGDAMVVQLRAINAAEEYMPLRERHYAQAVLVATSRSDAERLVEPLRHAARVADTRVLPKVTILTRAYESKLRGPRLASTIAGLVAMLVLMLACLGIFGVVAYAVRVRTREIGIRRALGADTVDVYGLLLRQLTWPVSIGMTVGTAGGLLASRLLSGDPFYLAVADVAAPAAGLAVFALSALTAALVPASRAMTLNPVRALRHD